MKRIRSTLMLALLLLLFGGMVSQASAEEQKGGLFVNPTTDDTWAAAKAILFAHEKVLSCSSAATGRWPSG
jgi:ABC-type sugar transport system substrate-binding protein